MPTTTPTVIDALRHGVLRAEAEFLRARLALIDAELAAAPVGTTVGTSVFDPAWKRPGRPHLSPEGEKAILSAFDRGLSQTEVSRLFRISERAAASWQRRWRSYITPAQPTNSTIPASL